MVIKFILKTGLLNQIGFHGCAMEFHGISVAFWYAHSGKGVGDSGPDPIYPTHTGSGNDKVGKRILI